MLLVWLLETCLACKRHVHVSQSAEFCNNTLREELPIREKNAQDHFWKTKTKTAQNWSRGAKTGELQHRISPAVDHNSYSTVRQRGIQTNCDVQGWKIRFTIRHRHGRTMI